MEIGSFEISDVSLLGSKVAGSLPSKETEAGRLHRQEVLITVDPLSVVVSATPFSKPVCSPLVLEPQATV